MSNELDELTGPVAATGRDVHVIDRQLPVTIGLGSVLFEVLLWACGIIPGIVFLFMKIGAKNYFRRLQQKIQADASTIDNYLEQRVRILDNLARLVERSVELDKDVMKTVAALRSGHVDEDSRSEVASRVEGCFARLFPHVEAYPELRSHDTIRESIRQNTYLQKEITAARVLYNDTVNQWNRDVFSWPTRQIVAARAGYTTRIPFTASSEVKSRAKEIFF